MLFPCYFRVFDMMHIYESMNILSGCPLCLHSSSTTWHVLPRLKNLSEEDEWELADRAAFKAVQDQSIAGVALF